jgi:hypothetical protein
VLRLAARRPRANPKRSALRKILCVAMQREIAERRFRNHDSPRRRNAMIIKAARYAMLALVFAMSAVSASARPTDMPITSRSGLIETRIHRSDIGSMRKLQSQLVPSREQQPFADMLLG